MSDILISYARADREVASSLAGVFQVLGYDVWWDRDLISGTDFEQAIQSELARAKVVVVLWSATSVRSGWVRDEATAALVRDVLVPVQLDGTAPPLGFRSLHTIQLDMVQPTALLRAVHRLIAHPGEGSTPRAVYPVPRRFAVDPIEASMALLVLLVLGFLTWRLFLP